jgi:drug/metabolite transporter (DMT)-like permease
MEYSLKIQEEDTLVFVWAYSCASALLWVPFSLILIVEGQQELDWRLAVGAVISSALHIAYSLILQAGYERAELGVVYPIARGSGPVLTILFATLLMGERLSPGALLGALSLSLVFSLSPAIRSGAEADHYRECFGGSDRHRHRWLYTLGRLFGNLSAPGSSALLRQHTPATESDSYPGAMRRRNRIPTAVRVDIIPILIIAVCSPCLHPCTDSHAEHATGTRRSSQETSIIVGSLLSYWLFRENHLARRIAGAVVVLTGINN